MYSVYLLTCVDTGRVYVGCTKNLARRYRQHARSPPPRMREDAAALTPWEEHFVMTVLESGLSTAVLAKRREAWHIASRRARGAGGYNEAPGSTTRGFWWRLRRGALARGAPV
jgi:hypothetical protein